MINDYVQVIKPILNGMKQSNTTLNDVKLIHDAIIYLWILINNNESTYIMEHPFGCDKLRRWE